MSQASATVPGAAYGLQVRLDMPYDKAVPKVTAALKDEGFGILTEIDVKATLKKKLDVDFKRYVILGACNPQLAHQALQKEPELGLLLPCNAIVFENDDGSSGVSLVDPLVMIGMVENPDLQPVADEAGARLTRVRDVLRDG